MRTTTTYKNFFDKAVKIWKEKNQEYQDLVFRKDGLQKKHLDFQGKTTATDFERQTEQQGYSADVAAVYQKMKNVRSETQAELAKLQEEFDKVCEDAYSLKTADIDQETAALLKSGISLTAGEVTGLLRRFEGNQTMVRLIDSYATKNGLKSGEIAYVLNKQRTPEQDKQAFDNLCQRASWSVNSDVGDIVWSIDSPSSKDAITETKTALGVSE